MAEPAAYAKFHAKHVRVTRGPFSNRVGVVQGATQGEVEVAWPGTGQKADRVWFKAADVEIVDLPSVASTGDQEAAAPA